MWVMLQFYFKLRLRKCKRIGRCVVKKPQFLNVFSVRKTFDRHSYVVELNSSFCQMLTDIAFYVSVSRNCLIPFIDLTESTLMALPVIFLVNLLRLVTSANWSSAEIVVLGSRQLPPATDLMNYVRAFPSL